MHLMRIVNGDRLVETLHWLALYSTRRYIYCLLKTLLAEVVHPSKYFHSRRHHHRHVRLYHYNPATNKAKRTFEPCTRYCHIHLACTSVRYERKMHVLIIRK